ncbi:unannotated protein [freshwater metagenome]|uniref:Unannotated protein n=1 Tax=freshwater metagenome TaxID=449393 RepID=A0A6J7DBU9_9ZZZZ
MNETLVPDWDTVRFVSLDRTSGGVSYETWIIDIAEGEAPDARRFTFVLRREPLRGPLEPYNVLFEAEVIDRLGATAVPVAPLLATCEDRSIIGRRFSVLGFVEGEVPDYRSITTREDWQDEGRRRVMTTEFLRVLAEIQRVDWTQIPSLAAAHGGPVTERERLHRLIDAMESASDRAMAGWVPLPIFRDAVRWCRDNAPDGPPEGMVLHHGDYKIGNWLWKDDTIQAILDWEGAMVADPLQDLGYACHPAMRESHPELMAMLAPIDEFLAIYEEQTGRTVDRQRLHYYVIYAMLFHTYTLLMGLPSIVEWDGDMRMATGYAKLNQVTRMLVDQIEAYEEGRGVL